ncbi:MAG: pyrroline-5-carboxylate reductase [Candidatus Margulisbacteria bacterium]|nr:pyrroline-5-carboxylate reductase [Candidatus Margulisiibacteriota bacterium]
MTNLAFIGAGKMAEALIAKLNKENNILAADINASRLQYLKKRYKIKVTKDNNEAFKSGDIVILAVKPQQMGEVLEELRPTTNDQRPTTLIISIAAGITLAYLQKRLPGFAVIRAMPNNPCLIGMGVTAMVKGKNVSSKQVKQAKAIFSKVGEVYYVVEHLMSAVTGLSGSGPAFVYQTIDALALGGREAGLPKNLAEKFALQTVIGAAMTVKTTGKTPAELTAMVASPGGTTIEGLKRLEKYELPRALKEAVTAAAKKSASLSRI